MWPSASAYIYVCACAVVSICLPQVIAPGRVGGNLSNVLHGGIHVRGLRVGVGARLGRTCLRLGLACVGTGFCLALHRGDFGIFFGSSSFFCRGFSLPQYLFLFGFEFLDLGLCLSLAALAPCLMKLPFGEGKLFLDANDFFVTVLTSWAF